MIGTGGVLTLLLVIAVVVGLSVDVSHRDWKGCDEDYWRRGCRLNREGDGYNNFLAVDLLSSPPSCNLSGHSLKESHPWVPTECEIHYHIRS
jgi:hypothetical protein